MGGHPVPYGITLVVDPLSAIIAFTIAGDYGVFARRYLLRCRGRYQPRALYVLHPLLACWLLGISLAFLTADLFTLYVAFEIKNRVPRSAHARR